jgi:hypothetical protein
MQLSVEIFFAIFLRVFIYTSGKAATFQDKSDSG